MKKKPEKMTFKEFWEELKKERQASRVLEKSKRHLMEILRREGFSDEQINEMKMEKVWKLFTDAMMETTKRVTKVIESMQPRILEKAEKISSLLATLWEDEKERELLVTDKGLRKDLFELVGAFEDLKAELDYSEELARQILEKFEEEKKRRKQRSI